MGPNRVMFGTADGCVMNGGVTVCSEISADAGAASVGRCKSSSGGASRELVCHGNFLGLRCELPAAVPLADFDIRNRQRD